MFYGALIPSLAGLASKLPGVGESVKNIGTTTGLIRDDSLSNVSQNNLDFMRDIYERDYGFREPERALQQSAWEQMMNTMIPENQNIPGMADMYQPSQTPDFQMFQPGQAPNYNQWQSGYTPQMYSPTSAPGQTPYNVDTGGGLGAYLPRQADPGGVYQRGEFNFQEDPGYQWRLGQGVEAIERSAAARGGRESGRTQKDLMEFGQGLASQEYQNAYNRYGQEEAAKQSAFESGAGRGLQAYGLQEPLSVQSFQDYANRGLTRDLTGAELGLGAYEGAMDRGLQGWQAEQQLGMQGSQDYQNTMMDLQRMGQGEQQFSGNLGLQSYLGQQGLQQAGMSDYNNLMSDMYRSKLPIEYQAYQDYTQEPWKQYGAGMQQDQDSWNRLLQAGGYQDPSAQGIQGGYDNLLQSLVGEQKLQQSGLQNLINLGGIFAGLGG